MAFWINSNLHFAPLGVKDQGRYATRLISWHVHIHPSLPELVFVSEREKGFMGRIRPGGDPEACCRFLGSVAPWAQNGGWCLHIPLWGFPPSLTYSESRWGLNGSKGICRYIKWLLVDSSCFGGRSPVGPDTQPICRWDGWRVSLVGLEGATWHCVVLFS